jgi:hypothetical protein
MTHPEDGTVAVLTLAFAAVGTWLALAAGVVLWLNTGRLLPSRRSRAAYWVGVALLAPAILTAVPVAATATKAVGVIASRGWDASAGGLRVVNKHGLLSDGSYLSAVWTAAMAPLIWTAMLLLAVMAAVWHLHYHPLQDAAHRAGNSPEKSTGRTHLHRSRKR